MVNIASHIFHGRHIIEVHLDLIFWYTGNISFDHDDDVVNVLCATSCVDGTKKCIIHRTNLNNVHQRSADNVLPFVQTNSVTILVDD